METASQTGTLYGLEKHPNGYTKKKKIIIHENIKDSRLIIKSIQPAKRLKLGCTNIILYNIIIYNIIYTII